LRRAERKGLPTTTTSAREGRRVTERMSFLCAILLRARESQRREEKRPSWTAGSAIHSMPLSARLRDVRLWMGRGGVRIQGGGWRLGDFAQADEVFSLILSECVWLDDEDLKGGEEAEVVGQVGEGVGGEVELTQLWQGGEGGDGGGGEGVIGEGEFLTDEWGRRGWGVERGGRGVNLEVDEGGDVGDVVNAVAV
jgi:hypothetical protein